MKQLPSKQELKGLQLGFLGVLIFSLTLPASRVAVTELDPVFVGLGRAIIAGVLAVILLIITRQSLPPKRFWLKFLLVATGIVVGFPLLTAIAMKNAPASYGAVITGLMPLATALYGVWRGREKVTKSFWIFASAILLHEPLSIRTLGFSTGVIICVASSRRF